MASTGLTAAWAALHTFQFGLAVSGLNGVQSALTCKDAGEGEGVSDTSGWLEPCIAMTPAKFGIVVSIFTLGGLTAALGSRVVHARVGNVGTLRSSACAVLVGSILLSIAKSVHAAIIARLIVGLGCGLATTTVPLVLAEIAPANQKRALGILNQLFIVTGVLVGQALSFPLGHAYMWRGVPAVSAVVAIGQLIGSKFVNVDPSTPASAEDEPLLERNVAREPLTILQLFTTKDTRVRYAFPLVLITQFAQQVCGVSAVMYFSTSILSPVFPGSAKIVALIVVILKIPATVAPAFLIERIGTRPLLTYPTAVMCVCLVSLAVGINANAGVLAVVGIVGFVIAFSLGLGPVTWVVLGEVMPPHARAAGSAVGLAVNWSMAFVVGSTFLPFQQWLAGGERGKEGNIFFVFATTTALSLVAIRWGYKLYERVEKQDL